jgi:hypothetical protein
MELDKQIEELKKQQQDITNKLVGANPQWCYLQGQIEALTSVQEDSKKEVKK